MIKVNLSSNLKILILFFLIDYVNLRVFQEYYYDDKFTMMNTKVNECHAALLENTQDSLDIIRSEVQKTNTFLYRLFVTIGLSLAFLSTFIGLVEWQLSHIK